MHCSRHLNNDNLPLAVAILPLPRQLPHSNLGGEYAHGKDDGAEVLEIKEIVDLRGFGAEEGLRRWPLGRRKLLIVIYS